MDQNTIKKYVTGRASSAEREEIVEWTKTDSNHIRELITLHKLHNTVMWAEDTGIGKVDQQPHRKRRLLLYSFSSVAALFIFLLGMGAVYLMQKQSIPESAMQTIFVPPGQRVELTLADGTFVWLNAGSTFTFPTLFSPDCRKVKLDGEGYFQVAKDNSKTFIIQTSKGYVEVLGTEFNLIDYRKSAFFELALLEGSVALHSEYNKEKIILKPNTKAYLTDNRIVTSAINNYDYFLWKEGVIYFDDEPLDEIANKLELYYDIRIQIEKQSIAKQKYTGKFRTKDGIEHILKVFQLRDKFTYDKNDDTNLITIK